MTERDVKQEQASDETTRSSEGNGRERGRDTEAAEKPANIMPEKDRLRGSWTTSPSSERRKSTNCVSWHAICAARP
jgi:hypothetical protein